MRIRPVHMEFRYGTAFLSESPEAYERLILDAMRGEATLFTRNDEIEALWAIVDPILTAWHEDTLARSRSIPPAHPGRRKPTACWRKGGRGAGCERLPAPETPVSEDVWSAQDTTPTPSRPRCGSSCASGTRPIGRWPRPGCSI